MKHLLNWHKNLILQRHHLKFYFSGLMLCFLLFSSTITDDIGEDYPLKEGIEEGYLLLEEIEDYSFIAKIEVDSLNDTVNVKIGSKDIDDEFKGYVKVGDIGEDYPCGAMFGISVEDDRYFFCKSSSMLATMTPDNANFLLPDGTILTAEGDTILPKTDLTPPNESKTGYSGEEIFNRINALTVGSYRTVDGPRIGILENDLKDYYPNQTFEIYMDGKTTTAFNPETLIYELLFTNQQQYEEIALLKLRLDQLESKLGNNSLDNSAIKNYIKIMVNPIKSNELELEYRISENVNNASIVLSTLSGKTLRTVPFKERGVGIESLYVDLSEGLYLCTLITDGNVQETAKFIVQ